MAVILSRREALIAAGAGVALSARPALAVCGAGTAPLIAVFDGRYLDPAVIADRWPAAVARLDLRSDVLQLWYGLLREWGSPGAFRLSGVATYADYVFLRGCWLEEQRRMGSVAQARPVVARVERDGGRSRRATLYSWTFA